jgi:hypothetical protein
MNHDEVVLNRFVVTNIWEVAQACVEESKKGWFVTMPEFRDAMNALDFTAKEVRATLSYLEARTYVITLPDEDGHVRLLYFHPTRVR